MSLSSKSLLAQDLCVSLVREPRAPVRVVSRAENVKKMPLACPVALRLCNRAQNAPADLGGTRLRVAERKIDGYRRVTLLTCSATLRTLPGQGRAVLARSKHGGAAPRSSRQSRAPPRQARWGRGRRKFGAARL